MLNEATTQIESSQYKMEINNFIVVRFSLKLSAGWQKKAYGSEENRKSWLLSRRDILKRTLYPSVLAQTTRPRKLILLLDESDKAVYKDHFDLDLTLVKPLFSSAAAPYAKVDEYISSLGLNNIAISRADSDDLIAEDYIENINLSIQEAAAKRKTFDYIVATRGYRSDGVSVQELYYNCSPYLTAFLRDWKGFNIYGINHEDVVKYDHVFMNSPAWMQYLHGGNLANQFLNGMKSREDFERAAENKEKLVALQRVSVEEFWPDKFCSI